MAKQLAVLGPPGTGKTSTLTDIEVQAIGSGEYGPGDVTYTTFTRNAADHARDVIVQKLGDNWTRDDFAYHGTIHSICGRLLNFNWGDRLLNDRDYRGQSMLRIWGKDAGYEFNFDAEYDEEADLLAGRGAEGNLLLGWYNWTRQCMHDLETGILAWRDVSTTNLTPARQRTFANDYEDFKRRTGVKDFTDILVLAAERGVIPPTRILILDEAQDLSPLQWAILDNWRNAAELVYLGGDDDQAIYSWMGADAELFLSRVHEGDIHKLEQSYRMPVTSHRLSQWIVRLIQQREEKPFRPRDHHGTVEDVGIWAVPFEKRSGSWFVLARNTFVLADARTYLEERAIPYSARRGWNPVKQYYPAARAISVLSQRNRILDRDDFLAMLRRIDRTWISSSLWSEVERGHRSHIPQVVTQRDLINLGLEEAFVEQLDDHPCPVELLSANLLPGKQRTWRAIRTMQRERGLDVWNETPRIVLSTIHGVKGDEADHVVLMPDMALASRQSLERDADGEHRVWYVACSRARDSLYILPPSNGTHYHYLVGGGWHETVNGDAAG